MPYALFAVMFGGAVGSACRWWVGLRLNALFPLLPMGTLLVNLVGGFVIGLALGFFSRYPGVDPQWKLLLVTGFCGGFTTFSTFSAEVVNLLQSGRLGWAALTVTVHVLGSLLLTLAGFALAGRLG
ncbi:chromosome condensation membrane protein [Pseudomonas psychrotolerans L19]|uniref:fluoride efflux transporter CrcB n=1 Tax=Pseudomonas TaxID=286 RepID=UPI00023A3491|nr:MULTISPECIES: fluoride efflux transporter CrcB [Pseudomonas]HCV78177.1 fluoride efflux transporter CrcB [Pseudomonas sp.]EHK70646.1 chromosome condensation membrane protein [Pseudomonas psychrotolerans L19]KTT55347.1 camphor resistance protein CrcB [Pseudomonas psychrotolerans]MBA1182137.1 fluoride efflux transporter CrcB [Pseudomonas psychrotolerans]MBA1212682.1 fluoride efflux transporter CrcB [Pseudomonas psychrotolerans]